CSPARPLARVFGRLLQPSAAADEHETWRGEPDETAGGQRPDVSDQVVASENRPALPSGIQRVGPSLRVARQLLALNVKLEPDGLVYCRRQQWPHGAERHVVA